MMCIYMTELVLSQIRIEVIIRVDMCLTASRLRDIIKTLTALRHSNIIHIMIMIITMFRPFIITMLSLIICWKTLVNMDLNMINNDRIRVQ